MSAFPKHETIGFAQFTQHVAELLTTAHRAGVHPRKAPRHHRDIALFEHVQQMRIGAPRRGC